MKLLLTNILFLLTANLYSQTDIGIGLVSINFDDKTVLQFYSDSNDEKSIKTIEFFNDTGIKSWNIRNLDEQKIWLKPEVLWLDYHTFTFRCLTKNENWFQVIVNNETGKTYWIKNSKLTKFRDWENYLKRMFGIARLQKYPQSIKTEPKETAEIIKYQGRDCFVVKSMKGDWIEISTPEYCDENLKKSNEGIKSGWIKWRKGNELIIDYFTTS